MLTLGRLATQYARTTSPDQWITKELSLAVRRLISRALVLGQRPEYLGNLTGRHVTLATHLIDPVRPYPLQPFPTQWPQLAEARFGVADVWVFWE